MNSTNETFYPIDHWFDFYGYTLIGDTIVTYFITSAWLFSLVLSIFSLFILLKSPFFASNFFRYMRLYVANCLILSVISATTIFAATHRFFSITNTYESIFYSIYVHLFTTSSLFLFSSCIEICLSVERILYLLPTRFKRIKLISFEKFFSILFVASLSVNVPGLFIFEPAFADIQLDQNKTFRIWYLGQTPFSYTPIGEISNYFGYIFRDLLPMLLKIVLNSLSVYLVRRYVKNKRKVRAATLQATSEMVNFDRNQTYVAFLMSTY